ncbi:MAG: 7-cyano-7-deazaguanine synthase QueC [Idiomarina sp.]|nr:7-cyano-7-deazaguanine synthase QueC [Idiomarina sp.]
MSDESTAAQATSKQVDAVVIYSGGMDSYTVLHKAIREGLNVHALSFHYGQRHSKELDVAAAVCKELGVPHQVVDIRSINTLLAGSALTSDIDVPDADYAEANMKATVVPNRNMILLSLAIGYAVSLEAKAVWYGAHSGDHAIYPDCRPEFVEAMNTVSHLANYEPIDVVSPYLYQSKADILADGLAMQLDYSRTWTCYNGRELACGHCSACRERLQSFAAHGVTDPLQYESA